MRGALFFCQNRLVLPATTHRFLERLAPALYTASRDLTPRLTKGCLVELVQFEIPGSGRRVGILDGDRVHDVTARRAELRFLVEAFSGRLHFEPGNPLEVFLRSVMETGPSATLDWEALWHASPGGTEPFLLAPLDHPDPHHVLVSGTGLTHTGSVESRDEMHRVASATRTKKKRDRGGTCDRFRADVRPGSRRRKASFRCTGRGARVVLQRRRRNSAGSSGRPRPIPSFALDGGEETGNRRGCYVA